MTLDGGIRPLFKAETPGPMKDSKLTPRIGHFHSLPIELVLTIFQILAALNFATDFPTWKSRTLRVYAHDAEAK